MPVARGILGSFLSPTHLQNRRLNSSILSQHLDPALNQTAGRAYLQLVVQRKSCHLDASRISMPPGGWQWQWLEAKKVWSALMGPVSSRVERRTPSVGLLIAGSYPLSAADWTATRCPTKGLDIAETTT